MCGPLSWGYGLTIHKIKWPIEYLDYKAMVEHFLGRLWHWGSVRNVWSSNGTTLHKSICILLPLTQFCIHC